MMVCEGLVDNWTPMRCGICCLVAVFSLPECFVPRVWKGARHCCRLQEESKEKTVETRFSVLEEWRRTRTSVGQDVCGRRMTCLA